MKRKNKSVSPTGYCLSKIDLVPHADAEALIGAT